MEFNSGGFRFFLNREDNKKLGAKVDTRCRVFVMDNPIEGLPIREKVVDVLARLHPVDRNIFSKLTGRMEVFKKALDVIEKDDRFATFNREKFYETFKSCDEFLNGAWPVSLSISFDLVDKIED